jgi:hypothetical protein
VTSFVFFLGMVGSVEGVQLADLELCEDRRELEASATEVLRFRLGLALDSSSLGEAVRLLEDEVGCCCGYASSHGLVRGEMSKSISVGNGLIWNAILAGAEFDRCWCGLC